VSLPAFFIAQKRPCSFTASWKFPGLYRIFQSCRALQRSQKLQAFTELILFAGVILCLNVKNVSMKNSISPKTTSSPARDAYILSILYGIWSISGGK